MKTLETNFNGGLRFNWDDLRWMQTGIKTVLDNIVKSLGNQESLYIIAGCETRTFAGDYGINTIDIDPGVIAINGELMRFDGLQESSVSASDKFWFSVETVNDPAGVKIDKYNQQSHQCYAEKVAIFNHGEAYPQSTYYAVEVIGSGSAAVFDIKDIYQILSTKLMPTNQNKSAGTASGWSISGYRFVVNGKIAMFNCTAIRTDEGGLTVATLSVHPPTGHTINAIGIHNDGSLIPLSLNSNGVIEVSSAGEIGSSIKISLTFIIE